MLTDGLYNLLATSPAITVLLGTNAARNTASNSQDASSGIFPMSAPEGVISPYIVYSQISGQGVDSFEGANPLNRARMEFSCYATSYEAAKKLARAVKSVLLGLSQTLIDGTGVDDILLASERDLFEDGPFQYRIAVDVSIWFSDLGS
jgi:hypothetical protein